MIHASPFCFEYLSPLQAVVILYNDNRGNMLIKNRWKQLFLLSLIPVFFAQPARAQAIPVGLWHAENITVARTFFYMVYDGKQVRLYDQGWKLLKVPVKIEGAAFEARLPFAPYGLNVTGHYQGGELKGKWREKTAQGNYDGVWSARRVVADGSWNPFAAFSSKKTGQLVDISGVLANDLPFKSFSEFETSWNKQIESKYYAALSVPLYHVEDVYYMPKVRTDRLKKIYSSLQANAKGFKKTSSRLARLIPETRVAVSKHYSWIFPDAVAVSLPTGGLFDIAFGEVGGRKALIFFSTDWLEESSDGALKSLIAQGMIYQQQRRTNLMSPNLLFETARRGIAAYLASKVFPHDSLETLLDVKTAELKRAQEQRSAFRQEFLKNRRRDSRRVFSKYFLSGDRASTLLLGYEFARMLSKRYRPQEMLQISGDRLRREFLAFVHKPSVEQP